MKLRKTGGVVPRFTQILLGQEGDVVALDTQGRVWCFVPGDDESQPGMTGWIELPKAELVVIE